MLHLRCPNCGKAFQMDQKLVPKSKTFPFCSEKCRMADLHGWLTERYRFSSPLRDEEKDEAQSGPEQKEDKE